eukprot:gene980-1918_t
MDEFHAERFESNLLSDINRDSSMKWIEDTAGKHSTDWVKLVQSYSILSPLAQFLSTSLRASDIKRILNILRTLSADRIIAGKIIDCNPSIISCLPNIIKNYDRKVRVLACEIYCNISLFEEYHEYLSNPAEATLPTLLSLISEQTDESRFIAFSTLENLSANNQIKGVLISEQLGLLKALMKLIITEQGEVGAAACSIVSYLSISPDTHAALMDPSLELLDTLLMVLRDDSGPSVVLACTVLGNLSSNDTHMLAITNPQLRMLPALVKILTSDNIEARWRTCTVLANLAVSDENKIAMADPALGLIEALRSEAQISRDGDGEGRINAMAALAQMASIEENVYTCIEANLWPLVIFLLESAGRETQEWSKTPNGQAAVWAVQFCMNMSQWDSVSMEPMTTAGIIAALVPLLRYEHRQSLCVFLTLIPMWTYLQECNVKKNLPRSTAMNMDCTLLTASLGNPTPKLIEILNNTAFGKSTACYKRGFFRLSFVLRATLHLSNSSNSTARAMISLQLGMILLHVLKMHSLGTFPNSELCSVDLSIRLLYRLSSAYKKSEPFLTALVPDIVEAQEEMVKLLKSLKDVCTTPTSSSLSVKLLSEEGKRFVSILLRRLVKPGKRKIKTGLVSQSGTSRVSVSGSGGLHHDHALTAVDPRHGNGSGDVDEESGTEDEEGDGDGDDMTTTTTTTAMAMQVKAMTTNQRFGMQAASVVYDDQPSTGTGTGTGDDFFHAARRSPQTHPLPPPLPSTPPRTGSLIEEGRGEALSTSSPPSVLHPHRFDTAQEEPLPSAKIKKKIKSVRKSQDNENDGGNKDNGNTPERPGMSSFSGHSTQSPTEKGRSRVEALLKSSASRRKKKGLVDNSMETQSQSQQLVEGKERMLVAGLSRRMSGSDTDATPPTLKVVEVDSTAEHHKHPAAVKRGSQRTKMGEGEEMAANATPYRKLFMKQDLIATNEQIYKRVMQKSLLSEHNGHGSASGSGSQSTRSSNSNNNNSNNSNSKFSSRTLPYHESNLVDDEDNVSVASSTMTGGRVKRTISSVSHRSAVSSVSHRSAVSSMSYATTDVPPLPAAPPRSSAPQKTSSSLSILDKFLGASMSACLPLQQKAYLLEQTNNCFSAPSRDRDRHEGNGSVAGYSEHGMGGASEHSMGTRGGGRSATDEAWSMLRDPQKVKDAQLLSTVLRELGVSQAAELQYCTVNDLDKLADTLKDVPRRMFHNLQKSFYSSSGR